MNPEDVKKRYGSIYRFGKETGMSYGSLANWLKWGYIPIKSQKKLELISKGELKAELWCEEKLNGDL